MSNDKNDQHVAACELVASAQLREKNEADTRHKIIDAIFHDVLSWPRNAVDSEKFIKEGYIDYLLESRSGKAILIIEAKREGIYFNIPLRFGNNDHTICKIKTLLTDENIKTAIEQVQSYCINYGCEHGCVTNGHEWIFFKAFEKNKNWTNLNAFVITKLNFFSDNFTKAYNIFNYNSLSDNYSLSQLLSNIIESHKTRYLIKDKVTNYDYEVNANFLAHKLRPILDKYFGVIDENDVDFMEKCYIEQKQYSKHYHGFQNIIHDRLTPYFSQFGVEGFSVSESGGAFGDKINETLECRIGGKVIILFGGKGSGKSTFLKKILYHNPPDAIKKHAVISILDLLNIPDDKELIHITIWEKIIELLDIDEIFKESREKLIDHFEDRYRIALRQDLFGLHFESETFNSKLNALVKEWLADKKYCATVLCRYWARKKRGIIISIDNTDQLSAANQDFSFTTAQEISKELNCLVIISMREERFYSSKIHGILDAFQNSGFHITSPITHLVFKRRLKYVVDLIDKDRYLLNLETERIASDVKTFLLLFLRSFTRNESPISIFMHACSHGDIRLALDLFANCLKSGYLNVNEMIYKGHWSIVIHQILRPMMIPDRFYYSETTSSIPNLYQIRSGYNSSHFTSLRILDELMKIYDPTALNYTPEALIKQKFADIFNMIDDYELNIDMLLKYGLIESSNRIDYYSPNLDDLKITTYGVYFYQTISILFTYIDLICVDCMTHNEEIANSIANYARQDFQQFHEQKKYERVLSRLEKVDVYIAYLEEEEKKETIHFNLETPNNYFTSIIRNHFELEKKSIISSAKKNC